MRRAATAVGALDDLAAAAGYTIESAGELPLLRYVLGTRPAGDVPGTRPEPPRPARTRVHRADRSRS